MMMHVAALERQADLTAYNSVLVGLGGGVITRMEIESSLANVEDANVWGKKSVHGPAKIVGRNRVRDIESRYLTERVDSGVGAARTHHMNPSSLDTRENLLENALNRGQTRLDLPTVVRSSVVCHSEANSSRLLRQKSLLYHC